jgi:hypothetical protein
MGVMRQNGGGALGTFGRLGNQEDFGGYLAVPGIPRA